MSSIVNAIGWALLHFVWQGAVVAVLFTIGTRMLKTADARYVLGVVAMLAMLALPVVTAARYASVSSVGDYTAAATPSAVDARATSQALPAKASPEMTIAPAPVSEQGATFSSGSLVKSLGRAASPLAGYLPILVGLWLAGVFLLSLRLFDAWLQARRLTRDGTSPASEPHRRTLERLVTRLGLRRQVSILESALMQSPAVVGWLRPVILLPAVALTGLTPQQVEALIAHELAHVKRHDFVANLVQSAIETLLFYHPSVWYVSRRVREIREHCCDDVAVRISGSADAYARALLGLAEARAAAPALIPAATGGPLLARIRRLLVAEPAVDPGFPRWIAGGVVVLGALALGSAGRVLEANEAESESALILPMVGDTGRLGADTVIHAPAGPLATRWEWARAEARRRNYRAFWVGYTIEPLAVKNGGSIYVGRLERTTIEGGVSLRGRIVNFGNFEGFRTPGVQLAPLIGGGMPDDVAILFLYTMNASGRPTLARVHASSLALPVELEGRPVLWLGEGSDAESIPLVTKLFDEVPSLLREDVVAMVGLHSSSSIVVPALLEWAGGRGPTDIRTEAVEWLGRHPDPRALAALARFARRDGNSDVRREAAEAVAEMDLDAATDTLIGLARTLEDADARREAVEGLGERGDDRSVAALGDVVRADPDEDIRREATEALGESDNPRAKPLLLSIARTHADLEIRREATETIGEHLAAAEAVPVLAEIARTDRSVDVQREAIETLGELHDDRALAIVEELASTHPNVDARREAVETLGETSRGDETAQKLARIAREDASADVAREAIETIAETESPGAVRLIAEIARTHPDADARREAVETLGELHDAGTLELLTEIARGHSDVEARREAVETLAESATAEQFIKVARELLDASAPEEVWHEVLESLEELEGGAGIPLLISTARSSANLEIRRHALETLADSDDPRARKLFEEALSR